MSAETDRWLAKRAAAGDQGAFDVLLESHRTRLMQVCENYRFAAADLSTEDLYQEVAVKLWQAIERYNPHRGPFISFASFIARQHLNHLWRDEHTQKRFTTEVPLSLDVLAVDDGDDEPWIPPSLHFFIDPQRVVIAREELRLCWEAATARQREAVGVYLAKSGQRGEDKCPIWAQEAVTRLRGKIANRGLLDAN